MFVRNFPIHVTTETTDDGRNPAFGCEIVFVKTRKHLNEIMNDCGRRSGRAVIGWKKADFLDFWLKLDDKPINNMLNGRKVKVSRVGSYYCILPIAPVYVPVFDE